MLCVKAERSKAPVLQGIVASVRVGVGAWLVVAATRAAKITANSLNAAMTFTFYPNRTMKFPGNYADIYSGWRYCGHIGKSAGK